MYEKLKEKILSDIREFSSSPDIEHVLSIYSSVLDLTIVEPVVLEDEDYKVRMLQLPSKAIANIKDGELSIDGNSSINVALSIENKGTGTRHLVEDKLSYSSLKNIDVEGLFSGFIMSSNNYSETIYGKNISDISFNIKSPIEFNIGSNYPNLHHIIKEKKSPDIGGSFSVSNLSFLNKSSLMSVGISREKSEILMSDWQGIIDELLEVEYERTKLWAFNAIHSMNQERIEGVVDKVSKINFIALAPDLESQKYRSEFFSWSKEINKSLSWIFNVDDKIFDLADDSDSLIKSIDKGAFPFSIILKEYMPEGTKIRQEYVERISKLESILKTYYINSDLAKQRREFIGSIAASEFLDFDKTVELLTSDEKPLDAEIIMESAMKSRADVSQGDLTLKQIKSKWSWLLKGDDYASNINKINEKLKSETVRDLPKILSIFSETIERRLVHDNAKDYGIEQDIFRIDSYYNVDFDEDLYNESYIERAEEEVENSSTEQDHEYYNEFDDDFDNEFDDEVEDISPETPVYISEYALESLANENMHYKEKLDVNYKIHKSFSSLNTLLGSYHTKDITWDKCSDNFSLNGLTASPVSSRKELLELGEELDNCAYTYLDKLLSGESFIYKVVDDSGSVVSSFELKYDDRESKFYSEQNYGYSNSKLSSGSKEVAIHDEFLSQVNSEDILIERDVEVDNSELMDSVDGDEDTLEAARIFSRYDFNTDAPHVAFFALTSIIDKDRYIDKLINSDLPGKSNDFFKEIEFIEESSLKLKISPFKLLSIKKELGIQDFDDELLDSVRRNTQCSDLSI